MESRSSLINVEVHAPICAAAAEMLTDDALRFIGYLHIKFNDRRKTLLNARKVKALEYDSGHVPHFLNLEEKKIGAGFHKGQWRCADIPDDLKDRRVEITESKGPVDRKMIINGLNSGACCYMADFEDSTSPTWSNLTEGQRNLRDAVRGTITFSANNGKVYAPRKDSKLATLMVRPRGWHLDEAHVTVNGKLASASLFDFGLYFFHNVHALLAKKSGPYFYLPKLENHLEARLWNDVFIAAQKYLGISLGTIKATVLIETITAVFEMEEILWELRQHSIGLNCGRWDYLFSYIKKFKYHKDKITPSRDLLTMGIDMMTTYSKLLIEVCHKRKTFAMGGMAAQIPIKSDAEKNKKAMISIQQDKLREVLNGHDGTWVAHPALVKIAKDVFDEHMKTPNQIESNSNISSSFTQEEKSKRLLTLPPSSTDMIHITSHDLHSGLSTVLSYCEAWLRGVGCIPLHHKMEDAATAEICRVQIWQWIHFRVKTANDGKEITKERVSEILRHLVKKQEQEPPTTQGFNRKWLLAGKLVQDMLLSENLYDFLTTVLYPHILTTAFEGDIIPEEEGGTLMTSRL